MLIEMKIVVSIPTSSRGFSLVELLLVMGILGTLFGLTTVNLSNLLPRANLTALTEKMNIDLRDQQLKAMIGDTEGRTSGDYYGVYIQSNQYVLFHGMSYSESDESNVVIELDDEFELSTSFADQVVIFDRGSGEVMNFAEGNSAITITNTANNESRTLTVNRLGVVED